MSHFYWEQCPGTTSSLLHIESVTLTPDPLVTPGVADMVIYGRLTENVPAPITRGSDG